MKKLLQLSFIPQSPDCGLFALRLWFGLTLLLNHGWGKLHHYSQMSAMFPDPLGIGHQTSLILALIAEVLGSICVVVGIATRFAAAVIFIELLVAFLGIHHHQLAMGPGSGELPWLYMGAALAIVLGGGGRHVLCKVSNKVDAPPAPAA